MGRGHGQYGRGISLTVMVTVSEPQRYLGLAHGHGHCHERGSSAAHWKPPSLNETPALLGSGFSARGVPESTSDGHRSRPAVC